MSTTETAPPETVNEHGYRSFRIGGFSFARDEHFASVTNLSGGSVTLPAHREVLLTSAPLDADGRLPSDGSAWIRLG